MFIEFLIVENCGAAPMIHQPKWPTIQKAIEGLNGGTHTMVCLVKLKDIHMDIGGGAEGRCVVTATADNETFYMAIEPARGRTLVLAKVNGQTNDYPAEVLVAKEVALRAAKLFAEEGEFEPTVQWRSTAEPGLAAQE